MRHQAYNSCAALALIGVLALTAGAAAQDTTAPERDPATMDTGLPLSDGLKAYDVEHYTLRHEIIPDEQTIAGSATIAFTAVKAMDTLELDFDGAFEISGIESSSGALDYERSPSKLFVKLGASLSPGEEREITVHYSGKPVVAKRAPWLGGFVWDKTPSGKPWIATAIQFEGCDVWFPCKDHPTGEAKRGLEFFYTVPAGLSAAGNGVLLDVEEHADGKRTFHWKTEIPTNVYGVALNVGPYVRLQQTLKSINGTEIATEFWAIAEHEEKARVLFEKEFPAVLKFMESELGPYAWGHEKMGVAETPHLGMEHQTINAYGNQFKRGAFGYDDLFEHEFAHEWFGNLMSASNTADMWLHEGGATYMDFAYTRHVMGEAAFNTQKYQRYLGIRSCQPVAPRGELSGDQVYHNPETGPQGDMYAKGAWVLNSLNYVVGEGAMSRTLKRLLYDTTRPERLTPPIAPRYRTTDDLLAIASAEAGKDLSWFFEVYVRSAALPELEVETEGGDLVLTWKTPDDLPFPMPIPVRIDGKMKRIEAPGGRARIRGGASADIQIDPNMDILRKLPTVPTCEERKVEEAARAAARRAAAAARGN